MESEISRKEEISKKYKIDFDKLEKEQIALAKKLEVKDKIDFSLADRFGGIDTSFIGNKMLCCVIVCNKDFEVIDRAYSYEKISFPYVPGFRNYRELAPMVLAFNKITERPDVIFVSGQGIIHPRLGLASHLGLAIGIPVIGAANSLIDCEVKGEDILKKGKKAGKVLLVKQGSNPIYISPGNLISIDSAYELSKKMVVLPHKRPEPLHLAAKYAREVREEIG